MQNLAQKVFGVGTDATKIMAKSGENEEKKLYRVFARISDRLPHI